MASRRRFNFLSASRVLFFVVLFSLYIAESREMLLTGLYAFSLAFFLATTAVIVGWIPAPRSWVLACLVAELLWSTLVVSWVTLTTPGGPMPALFAASLVPFYLYLERRWLRPAMWATTLLWLLTFLPELRRLSLPWLLLQIGIYGAFLLLAAAMGAMARNLTDEKERSEHLLHQVQESQTALELAHQRLQESAARQQQLAVLQERQRLAREVHDSVAHNLTALVVQIQAARRTLQIDTESATERLEQCEATARQALQETRLAVRALHPAGLDGRSEVEALRRLGRDFGAAAGVQVEVTAAEEALRLPPDPNRVEQLYRIFQEALTNAHRHGQATRVTGGLALADDHLTLTITNNGRPPSHLRPGVGLRSMEERANSLGGRVTFEAGPLPVDGSDGEPIGLRIQVAIPLTQEVGE